MVSKISLPTQNKFVITHITLIIMQNLQHFPTQDLWHELHAILAGLLGGARYGIKIRLPHALVMTWLFRKDLTTRGKLRQILRLTMEHALHLASFATIYKVCKFVNVIHFLVNKAVLAKHVFHPPQSLFLVGFTNVCCFSVTIQTVLALLKWLVRCCEDETVTMSSSNQSARLRWFFNIFRWMLVTIGKVLPK